MKKRQILILSGLIVCGIISGQHLIRVNNNPGAGADYATLQEANDNASDGDTIYMEGSVTNYEGANISRRLTIIGPGYFLSENDSTQANKMGTIVGTVYFNSGSAGSIITGISNVTIYIRTDDISVTRCNISQIYIDGEVDQILIVQNYLYQLYEAWNSTFTNGIISNNIVTYAMTLGQSSGPLQITNNVFTYLYSNPLSAYNASIANNIICYQSGGIPVNTGNTITNNILASDGTNSGGNQYNVAMANVFVDFNGDKGFSTDGKWQLRTGSPATGAGVSGVDCGVFGGVTPYVLSGVPALPHIYEAEIPGTAYSGEGLNCSIKIKSGK